MIRIERILDDKKKYLDLLLLADEQEDMIEKYLYDGDLYALFDDDLKSVCVVLPIDSQTCELKNLATYPQYQRRGYASALQNHIFDIYRPRFRYMLVGTGEVPSILAFYRKFGFEPSHRIKNFFIDNYDQLMFEEGVQLVDMIYLKKDLEVLV